MTATMDFGWDASAARRPGRLGGRAASADFSAAAAAASGLTVSSRTEASNGFLRTPSGCDAGDHLVVQRFQRADGDQHARAPVPRAHLDELADLVAGAFGHDRVGQDDVRIDILQADQGRVAIADGDYFVALLAEDALAHALGVRAVIGEQDAGHQFPGSHRTEAGPAIPCLVCLPPEGTGSTCFRAGFPPI